MSDYTDQVPFIDAAFADDAFAENPEPRCPCLLLLDTSGSMSGQPIRELNSGLTLFKDELMTDEMAVKRIEIGLITFGPVKVEADFQAPDAFIPPTLNANGGTPMGEAIMRGLEMLRSRKEVYKRNGVSYYRPWIFLITDGGPTDDWKNAAKQVHAGEEAKSFMFYAVGVQGANMETLRQISVRDPLKLDGLRFRDLFAWLSGSLSAVSSSTPGDLVPMKNPTAPGGWGLAG